MRSAIQINNNLTARNWTSLPHLVRLDRAFGHHLITEQVIGRETVDMIVDVSHAVCFGWLKRGEQGPINIKRLMLPLGYYAVTYDPEQIIKSVALINWLVKSSSSPYRKLHNHIVVHTGSLGNPAIHNPVAKSLGHTPVPESLGWELPPVAIEVINTVVDNRSIINFLIAIRCAIVNFNVTDTWYDLVHTYNIEATRAYYLAWHINVNKDKNIFAYGYSLGGDVPFNVAYNTNTEKLFIYNQASLLKMLEGDIPVVPATESRNFRTNQVYTPCNVIWYSNLDFHTTPLGYNPNSKALRDHISVLRDSLELRLQEERTHRANANTLTEPPKALKSFSDLGKTLTFNNTFQLGA